MSLKSQVSSPPECKTSNSILILKHISFQILKALIKAGQVVRMPES